MKEDQKIKVIAELLSNETKVTRFNDEKHNEAWTIAHGLIDIASSSQLISDQIEELLAEGSEEDTIQKLLDIGEELKHIIYHINDMRFYSYIK